MCCPLRGSRGTPYTQKPLKIYRKKGISCAAAKMRHNLKSLTPASSVRDFIDLLGVGVCSCGCIMVGLYKDISRPAWPIEALSER
jgi:hypothetical protein